MAEQIRSAQRFSERRVHSLERSRSEPQNHTNPKRQRGSVREHGVRSRPSLPLRVGISPTRSWVIEIPADRPKDPSPRPLGRGSQIRLTHNAISLFQRYGLRPAR